MKKPKVWKQVKLNLEQEDYDKLELLAKTKNLPISVYIKDKLRIKDTLVKSQIKKAEKKFIDPELLYQLNRIGVNLNQIAKKVNAETFECIEILEVLKSIESELQGVLNDYKF